MKSGVSRAAENRAIRQDELRAKLSAGSHVNDVIDNANKIQDLTLILDSTDIARLKAASEIKLKLINKYLPDVKQVELEANLNVSGELKHELVRAEVVNEASST